MPNYTKYRAYKKQRRAVGASTWEDVVPLTLSIDGDGTMPPIVLENPSEDCGYVPPIEPMYKWVDLDPSVDWICDDEPEAIEKWVQTDETICDEPRAFENNFKIKAFFDGGNEQTIGCDGYEYVNQYTVRPVSAMTSGIVGDCVSNIEDQTFYNFSNLRNIQLHDHLYTLGDYCFAGCTSLSALTIPSSVLQIGTFMFQSCESLTSMDLSNLNERITVLPYGMFWACTSLTSVTFSEHIESIGEVEPWLDDIEVHMMWNGAETFTMCSSLTEVNMNEGLKYIGGSTFRGCTSLTSLTLPSTVEYIGLRAFETLNELTSLATTPPRIKCIDGEDPEWVINTAIYVPSQSVNAYKSANGWSKYADKIQAITN